MYVGIDVGGTNTRIVVSESFDDVVFAYQTTFTTPLDFNPGVEAIIDYLQSLNLTFSGIGIGVPGSVTDGMLDGSTNLPNWVNCPLAKTLTERFDFPVIVTNDAICGALGEAHYGGWGEIDFLYLTWGTGVGVAQVHWQNAIPNVGRPADREPIYAFEREIGGKDVATKLGKPAEEISDSDWEALLIEHQKTIHSLANTYSFDQFVIGGGIAVRKQELLKTCWGQLSQPQVGVTKLAGEAGLYGALALLR